MTAKRTVSFTTDPRRVTAAGIPGVQGVQGVPGTGGDVVGRTITAGEVISALRVVVEVSGQFFYADPIALEHQDLALWFVTTAANEGANLTGYNSGLYADGSWDWSEAPIFLGANGTLTQAPDFGAAFLRQIATSVNPTTILFNPQEGIEL